MNDLVPHAFAGHALHVVTRTVAGRPVTELRADGRHVVSWPGLATRSALQAAVRSHQERHALRLDGWTRIGRIVAQERRGGPPTARDAARLRHIDRCMNADWRLLHRLWAAADWLQIDVAQIPLPPPDGQRRLDAHYPPFVEPEPPTERPKRKPRKRQPSGGGDAVERKRQSPTARRGAATHGGLG